MVSIRFLIAVALSVASLIVPAQTTTADADHQFDFLLGQWSVAVHPKVNGLLAMIHGTPKLGGIWKAQRAADGNGIDDELRITDSSGNPVTQERTQRRFESGHWIINGNDTYHGRHSESRAQWIDGEMHIEGSSFDNEGKKTRMRTRYYDIDEHAFRLTQDRSTDDGQTWDEGTLTIEATRTSN